MELSGWIKSHRKIIETSWFKKPATAHLAIYLLHAANWKPSATILKRQKAIIEIGQLATGFKKLAEATGLTIRNIRTSLEILKNTDFLTSKATNHGTIITIIKYSYYQNQEEIRQANRQTNDKPTTNQRQTDDNIIRSKELKELKEVKNTTVVLHFEGRKLKIPVITHKDFESKYPGVILSDEYVKMDDWLFDHPEKKIKNHSQFARNWLNRKKTEIKQEFGSTIPYMKARD